MSPAHTVGKRFEERHCEGSTGSPRRLLQTIWARDAVGVGGQVLEFGVAESWTCKGLDGKESKEREYGRVPGFLKKVSFLWLYSSLRNISSWSPDVLGNRVMREGEGNSP